MTILFVVDVLAGLSPLDKEIAGRLRASSKKVILVANKADNYKAEHLADEFHELGFGKIHTGFLSAQDWDRAPDGGCACRSAEKYGNG